MNRWTVLLAAFVILVAMGCSSGGGNPVTPTTNLTNSVQKTGNTLQTHLWGYYDVYIDIPTQTATAVMNRDAMFAANVVQFVNKPPTNLNFTINDTPIGADFIDVDIDVAIKHPFTGLTQYNGYDVRGIFMGNASGTLDYNSDLKYPVLGTDQFMLWNPVDGYGAPDGYTRWFNAPEFMIPGLFGYKPGVFASKAYKPSATLCPYKYFADGLGAKDNLWNFLTTTTDNGVFSAGTTNTRKYYLRFPNAKGIKFAYAIVANWIDETTHPANAPESVDLLTSITPNIYWVSGSENGGDLILDLDVFGWEYQPSTIFIESTVLSSPHEFTADEMIPTGGDATYSTYHCEIPADAVSGLEGNELWVICRYDGFNYTNAFGITNSAGTDKLAAFYRHDLFVASEPHTDPLCDLQVVTPMPHNGDGKITFDITGPTYYDGAVFASASWDFNGDGTFGDAYDAGTDQQPVKYYTEDYVGQVCVQITDDQSGATECCADVDITYNPLWKETFDQSPSNWAYQEHLWEPLCSFPGAPGWTSVAPFGPSGSGNVRFPPSGNVMDGGLLATVVSVPFTVPTGSSDVELRVYMCEGFGWSWACFKNSNWKIVESSSNGMSPFNPTGATLPSGGQYLQNSKTHGSTWPLYQDNPCYCYGPMYGQPGWDGNSNGGGAFPSSLTAYLDLVIPSTFYGKSVKVCWQFQTDECGQALVGGFAMDDFELKLY